MNREFTCTDCNVFQCMYKHKTPPARCISKKKENAQVCEESRIMNTHDRETIKILEAASSVEHTLFGQLTRVEEIILFAKKIEAKKVGIVSCIGLIYESKVFAKVVQANNMEPYGIACKVGDSPYSCNPVMQAKLCNQAKTDLNVILGLCVGHDTLFIKNSDALITYLVVKDRVLAHNPIGALNTSQSYYARIMEGLNI